MAEHLVSCLISTNWVYLERLSKLSAKIRHSFG